MEIHIHKPKQKVSKQHQYWGSDCQRLTHRLYHVSIPQAESSSMTQNVNSPCHRDIGWLYQGLMPLITNIFNGYFMHRKYWVMKVSLGGSLGVRAQEQCFIIPTASDCKTFIRLTPTTFSVLKLLTNWQNIILRPPPPSQNFRVKRQKQPLRSLSTSHQWKLWMVLFCRVRAVRQNKNVPLLLVNNAVEKWMFKSHKVLE